jgi:hypothetical protein
VVDTIAALAGSLVPTWVVAWAVTKIVNKPESKSSHVIAFGISSVVMPFALPASARSEWWMYSCAAAVWLFVGLTSGGQSKILQARFTKEAAPAKPDDPGNYGL